MRADIHDGQEHNRSMQGPDTEAQDHPPFVQIQLATHGRANSKHQDAKSSGRRRAQSVRAAKFVQGLASIWPGLG
jgi:hypothetical protein